MFWFQTSLDNTSNQKYTMNNQVHKWYSSSRYTVNNGSKKGKIWKYSFFHYQYNKMITKTQKFCFTITYFSLYEKQIHFSLLINIPPRYLIKEFKKNMWYNLFSYWKWITFYPISIILQSIIDSQKSKNEHWKFGT